MKILVTGGAGFIGSHIVDLLVEQGYQVRVLDNLEYQVHLGRLPEYLNRNAEYIFGDVRDYDTLRKSIEGVEVIFHEAAAVGVGQSMYEVRKYVDVNVLGSANLLNILANEKHHVRKLLVASSMSIYGEGKYRCHRCGFVSPGLRGETQLSAKDWEMRCPNCQEHTAPAPTSEDKPVSPQSIYAISKRDQEEMFLVFGRSYGIPTVALRYFNVYGPRQSLSNPYTGVAAIFMSRIKNGNPPVIYEDGLQTRDFVSVQDVARVNLAAMKSDRADYQVFNVGTGTNISIKHVADVLTKIYGSSVEPKVTNLFRKGDIRHCYADTKRINTELNWEPSVSFEDGMKDLVQWSETALAYDWFERAAEELKQKGLV